MENPSIMNHVSIAVSNAEISLPFYDKVLSTLGAKRIMEHPGAIAYGKMFPEFWVHPEAFDGGKAEIANGVHFAFFAASKEEVRAFDDAALATWGTDDGAPGPRPDYGEPYYGCFSASSKPAARVRIVGTGTIGTKYSPGFLDKLAGCYLNWAKQSRTWSTKISGCSNAAKCPPLSMTSK